jgi:mono/diheme cytochrome c family protein
MWLRLTLLASSLGLIAACAGSAPSANASLLDANLAKAKQVTPPGAEVFERQCAACHGQKGEGLSSAPPVIGPGALPTYKRDPNLSSNPAMQSQAQYRTNESVGADKRGAFVTAKDLFDYTSREMPLPQSKKGSLSTEDYWAVVNYMLIAHGVNVPEGGVNEQNAASVKIQPAE